MSSSKLTRRQFIGATLAAGAAVTTGCANFPSIVPRHVLGGPRFVSPSEKLRIACIGVGGIGRMDIDGLKSEHFAAFCDVDDVAAKESFDRYPDVPRFRDFREMFDAIDDIDAVCVSTPDHTHYVAAMTALARGKHIFVQKPLCHCIEQVRLLTEEARRMGVATQMGIQSQALEHPRLLREWLAAGAIGNVREIHLWTDRPIWPQGLPGRPDPQEPPATLDWDLWLGPAHARPYNEAYVPFKWRGWWEFGTGALGDMGCHIMHATFLALDLGAPTSVSAETSPVNEESAPAWSIVTYDYPARANRDALKVIWYDGGKLPQLHHAGPALKKMVNKGEIGLEGNDLLVDGRKLSAEGGQLIVGDEGAILCDAVCSTLRIVPNEKMKAFKRPKKSLPRSPGHYEEWIQACKGGAKPGANFDYAGPLSEAVLLGNLAIRTGHGVEWDSEKLRSPGDAAASKLVRIGDVRRGWKV
jgi:predicted dehydrogenase